MLRFFIIAGLVAGCETKSVSVQDVGVQDCTIVGNNIPCVHYIEAHDGDTFTVDIDAMPTILKRWHVRIRGVDTAEVKGKTKCEKQMAEVAKEVTNEVLRSAKNITLKNIGKDKYFRLLADVDVDGKDLASELLTEQIAVPYDGGTKANFVCPTALPPPAWTKFQEAKVKIK